jgi:hypothetical protein
VRKGGVMILSRKNKSPSDVSTAGQWTTWWVARQHITVLFMLDSYGAQSPRQSQQVHEQGRTQVQIISFTCWNGHPGVSSAVIWLASDVLPSSLWSCERKERKANEDRLCYLLRSELKLLGNCMMTVFFSHFCQANKPHLFCVCWH